MYFVMDMGTTNTRLWLVDENKVIAEGKGAFGAGCTKAKGKDFLYSTLKDLIEALLCEAGVSSAEVEGIFAAGMAGSELGICDVPHISLPADRYALAGHLSETALKEITDIPFFIVPGLKKMHGACLSDIMRGEETEITGILRLTGHREEAVYVLPGTHNKVICVSETGEITDFYTTLSGEILSGCVNHSVLTGSVSFDFEIVEAEVLHGAEYARQNGLFAALFHVRVMEKNGKEQNALSSFLYGAVIGEDVERICREAGRRPVYIGGRESLRRIYGILLDDRAVLLDDDVCGRAVFQGILNIYSLHRARARREQVCAAIEREKLITIIRHPEKESLPQAMGALIRGGVRLAEVTFDRSGKFTKTYTADMIRLLVSTFGDELLVGAGTVMSPEEVMMAYEAGASFIISPDCNPAVITLTKKLGLVSIPAAFTPTEIAAAVRNGADFVKLFPADQAGKGYLRAVKAPLSDAKILAVGGVTPENAGEYIKDGFCGVGVGAALYDKKRIAEEDWDGLSALARSYLDVLKNA